MIWSHKLELKLSGETTEKVSLMKNENQARNTLKKNHNLNHESTNSSVTQKHKSKVNEGKEPDWKFEKDFKPLDGLFTKRYLWLRATSLHFICKLPSTIKKIYVVCFFYSFLSSDGDKHQTWLIFHGNIIMKLRKKLSSKHLIFSYALRPF